MEKKKIVVYGDSNTYGYSPDGNRYINRYGVVLNRILGDKYQVFEEGLVGRTTVYDDERIGRKAIDTVVSDLNKYEAMDYLFIMLGTNDYKIKNARLLSDLDNSLNLFLDKIKTISNIGRVILISPILLDKNIEYLDKEFDHNSYILSNCAATVYKDIADKNGFLFFDAKSVAFAGSDGEHFTEESHISLGNALANFIKRIEG